MRYFTYLLLATSIAATTPTSTDPPKLSPAQQEVINVRDARAEAARKRDMGAWARYVADDCIFSDDDGVRATKAQFIEHLGKLPLAYDNTVNPREYVVHLYGNTAVMNYRTTVHEQFTDTDIISEQRASETYVKQNGSWLLVARQWDNLPINFRKPVTADTSVYKDYVGQYERRPDGGVDTVTVKDGKLWSNLEGDEEQALPLGSDTFFFRDELGNITFVRDAQGRVTGYTHHRADGQEIHVKKIR